MGAGASRVNLITPCNLDGYFIDTGGVTMNIPVRHLSVNTADINVLLGALSTVIDQHADDPDVRAFTDRLHELEGKLLDLNVSILKEVSDATR